MKSLRLAAIVALGLFAARVVPSETPGIADLDWLSGHWCGGNAPEYVEEYWLAARGRMLIGLSRTTRGERTLSFEFMRIVAVDSIPTLIAQPDGGAAVAFTWSAGGSSWARFENPAHDFPKRVEYRRAGNRLHAQIAGPGENAREQVIPFEYERCGND